MVLKEVLTLGGVPESPYLSKFLDPAKLINKFYNMKAQLKSPKKKTPKPEPPTPVPLYSVACFRVFTFLQRRFIFSNKMSQLSCS